MKSSTALIFLVAAALSGPASISSGAEARAGAEQAPAPVPRAPARPQPAVDPLTASIHGRVTTADSGAPIRRAEVRAIAKSGISRLITTDADGRFELRDMPAGEFRLTVSKSGFVTLTYGQRRPFEAFVPIVLKQGQRFTANVGLPRGAVIAGRVYDEGGEPIANARVQALRSRTTEGRRRLEPAGPIDVTDDTGAYRVYGLPPGDYYLSASPLRRQETLPMGAPLERRVAPTDVRSTMTTFYPGTASLDEAQRVTLGVGGESRADIQISTVRAAVVSGIVLSSTGAPAGDATITLRSDAVAMGVSAVMSGPPPLMISGHSHPDGTFVLPGVPPGPYTLTATVLPFAAGSVVRTTTGAAGVVDSRTGQVVPLSGTPLLPETVSVPVVVSGSDVTGLTLNVGSGGSAEGTFVPDAGVTQPIPGRLEVSARPVNGSDGSMRMVGGSGFRIMGTNGAVYLMVEGLPEGWAVKSMLVDGTDMTDQPVDLRNGRNVNVRFVLTDRVTVVTGSVTDGPGRDSDERSNQNVVVFPEDSKKWTYPSRYLRTVRTDDQGTFRISGLPPDERYLAVAVDFLEDGEGSDPEFLERLRTRATSFSLGEAERKNVELRVIQR